MNHPVIHVVRRFGRVGGMESYVWHLVHELSTRGIQVFVVCETVYEEPNEKIRIIKVKSLSERHRWRAMMRFRERVAVKLRERFAGTPVLIHSHERSFQHQITTFHGPPIGTHPVWKYFSFLNLRISAWREMEKAELFGPNVDYILFVSNQIMMELKSSYPLIAKKKLGLAWPGTNIVRSCNSAKSSKDKTGIKFLFVGKEWKRKGLDLAVRIVAEFRRIYSHGTLTVIGVDAQHLPRSLQAHDWLIFSGWVSDIPWADFDILLHPARKEPFGMVVGEARANGIPVAMSTNVGASDLNFLDTQVIDFHAPLHAWTDAIAYLLSNTANICENKWTWADLADLHVNEYYPSLDPVIL